VPDLFSALRSEIDRDRRPEADLVMERGQRRLLFEIKLSKAPQPSRGFYELIDDLRPESATVVAPVDGPYEQRRGVWAMGLTVKEVKDMLKSYEAVYEKGHLTWLDEQPNIDSARVIVTVLVENSDRPKRRSAPSSLSGQVEILGDIVSPLVDEKDWECLK
jgi:hypothetical protein